MMKKPKAEEIEAYAKSIDFEIDGDEFIDYYASQGWKKANGRPLECWKAAVRTWKRRNKKKPLVTKTRLFPISGKTCYKRGCSTPAVYKKSGEYDSFYCGQHMPDSVKEKFCG